MMDFILFTILGLCIIALIFCLITLFIIIFVHDSYKCMLWYAYIYDRKSYNAYIDILKSDKVKFCTNEEYSMSHLNYKNKNHNYESTFEYDKNTYYILTDLDCAVFKEQEIVLCSFYNFFLDDIKNKKSEI